MDYQNLDEQLLQRIHRKDRNALELLYNRYERLLFHAAYRMTLDEAKAEEILKELFTELWTFPHSFNPSGKERFSAKFLKKCMERCHHQQQKPDRPHISAAIRA
ncbi:RNA polymerase sigma factor [Fictibacillus aquaticus]|uniref:RNA polymerase sigma-70 region 2 domain-containing protein n=1 Tax=Fictibacillus aquaticus TaxID=2021314 RepID=A0A235FD74_9BACL|nr:sigma factor [Fictibacillus aquaticus]OYD59286.1 hypothetical protein CGZ90_05165 [Fictibacillus aquaticus]